MGSPVLSIIGDRPTSDVVVRLRTQEGRDEWFYCHSHILIERSKYFGDRLSENWPTCQIIDSRNCVEVYCQESDFDHYVNFLRLLYVAIDSSTDDVWNGVKNVLGILRVAIELVSPKIVSSCVNYIEAVPWDESEEEEILRIIPSMGSQAEPILARLQPVNPSAIRRIFLSAIRFATSSPPSVLNDLKTSAQEQLEYMLTEDDDAPLLATDNEIKCIVKECLKGVLCRFNNLLDSLLFKSVKSVPDLLDSSLLRSVESVPDLGKMQSLQSHLSDMSWACQISSKLEIMHEIVYIWIDSSDKILEVMQQASTAIDTSEIKLKVIEIAAKVLEAMGYGTVILPTAKRLHMVKVWLPFVRATKPLFDSVTTNCDESEVKIDGELWQSLELAFVSIVLALPSGEQAAVLIEWLGSEHIRYPDFTEAFEVWCYRSKVAKRRLSDIKGAMV